MPTTETIYSGRLRTESTHLASGSILITDAPLDNYGKGEAFSPTDLLATSLGCCMLTLMGITANKNNFNIDGTRITITKIMESNPRRVSEVHLNFDMPEIEYTDEEKRKIYSAAVNCPVAKSLHPDINQVVHFNYKK